MTPGNDMSCGAASSETARPPPLSDSRMWRRVRSASAPKTASSSSSAYLTIRFSICPAAGGCQAPPGAQARERRLVASATPATMIAMPAAL